MAVGVEAKALHTRSEVADKPFLNAITKTKAVRVARELIQVCITKMEGASPLG